MGTQINGGFDHSDETITLIFENGKRHTLKTCQSIEYSNAPEAGQIGGNQPNPVTLTSGKADPSWSAEIAKHEYSEIIAKMGAGYLVQNVDVQVIYRRPSLPQTTDTVLKGRLGDGTKSAWGDPALCTLGGKCQKVLLNGLDPFERALT